MKTKNVIISATLLSLILTLQPHTLISQQILGGVGGNTHLDSTIQSNEGTEFWITIPLNMRGVNDGGFCEIYITSKYGANVSIKRPTSSVIQNFSISPGGVERRIYPRGAFEATNSFQNRGTHIQSDSPISVYVLSHSRLEFYDPNFPVDDDPFPGIPYIDGYTAIPVNSLGKENYLLTYTALNTGLNVNNGRFVLLGTEDNTSIDMSIKRTKTSSPITSTITLNKGQTYTYSNSLGVGDLSGSTFESDKPICVYGGIRRAHIPIGINPSFSWGNPCDYTVEQMISNYAWGRMYLLMPLGYRRVGEVYRVIAQKDSTIVMLGDTLLSVLNSREYVEFEIGSLDPPASYQQGSPNFITSNKPIKVSQYSKRGGADFRGDAFQVVLPPVEQYKTNYLIGRPTHHTLSNNNWINIYSLTENVDSVIVNNTPLPSSSWIAIPGTKYSAAQVKTSTTVYSVSSPLPIGLVVYGFGSDEGYGFSGGQFFSEISEAKNLQVSLDNSVLILNSLNKLKTLVFSNSNNSLDGVKIDIEIKGANPCLAYMFSHTELDYNPQNLGFDTIIASLGPIADTLIVEVLSQNISFSDTCHAENVVSFNPGLQKNGQPVNPDRLDPTIALGPPDNADNQNFVSVGISGELVLDFGLCSDQTPKVAVGDITIVETSFGNPTCAQYPEKADIYGRKDTSDSWTFMGQLCLTGTVNTDSAGLFDGITQIKIVDATGNNTPSRDGYDVDGIIAVCFCGPIQPDPCICESPDSVVSYVQGTRRDGNPVLANRSDPYEATGIPEDDDTFNFFTLGYGGNIVLKWTGNTGVLNTPNADDIRIVETSFKNPACRRYPETAAIELSLDGINWVIHDTICLDGNINIDNYSFQPNECVKYIRVTDVTNPFGGGATDGYDLDGILCLGTFKTAPSSKTKLVEDDFIKIFPNPASNAVTIEIVAMEDNHITVSVFNMMGQRVASFSEDGLISTTLDVSQYSAGLYFIEIDVDGVIFNEKLMVQKD